MKKFKVMVTGGKGFIGSYLCDKIEELGHEVFSVDNRSNRTYRNIKSRKGDLDCCVSELSGEDFGGVTHCFHLGAMISVDDSLDNEKAYYVNNFDYTRILLNQCVIRDIKFIFASTSECYGTAKEIPITINHPLNPQSPYALSKLMADRYCYLAKLLNPQAHIKIVRCFNTYGFGQSKLAVISKMIHDGINKGKIFIYGDGSQQRDYTHVRDVANEYAKMLYTDDSTTNIGSGMVFSINDIAHYVYEALNKRGVKPVIERIAPREGEVKTLVSDGNIEGQAIKMNDTISEITDYYLWGKK